MVEMLVGNEETAYYQSSFPTKFQKKISKQSFLRGRYIMQGVG